MNTGDILVVAILVVAIMGACIFTFKNNLHMAKCSGCCQGCPNQCGQKKTKLSEKS